MLAQVIVNVFGLFHPTELDIVPAGPGSALEVHCASGTTKLEGSGKPFPLAAGCTTSGRFILTIPGRIRREFEGRLEIKPGLAALVTMDLETAVASSVAAELPDNAPREALEAQAIAVRSYYASRPAGRHAYNAFCDTTHCQHIRGTISANHPAKKAALATKGLVLDYNTKIVTAMYSAACTGRRQAGVVNVDGYHYSAVNCDYCKRTPSTKKLQHSRGLCQSGAAALAHKGKSAEEILRHYYPGTTLRALSNP